MDKLIVTAAPHIHANVTTRKLMGRVCIALLPALAASCFIFGIAVLVPPAVSAAACVGFEALWNILLKSGYMSRLASGRSPSSTLSSECCVTTRFRAPSKGEEPM